MKFNYIKSIAIATIVLGMGVTATSCGDDEPELTQTVTFAEGASTNIQLRWSDSMTLNAVAFNASGDWVAEIYPADSNFTITTTSKSYSYVDWLEVSPYSGTSGSISATLIATPNHSSEARYAVIRVNAYSNSIEFHVTQQGMPTDSGTDTPLNPTE